MTASTDKQSPVYTERFPKKIQYLALLAIGLVNMGDGVELYLPSVITQPLSCEMGLSPFKESMLGVVLYISAATTILFVVPLSNRFGRRPLLLSAIYLAIIVTVFCALVPDYHSLVVSRVCLGMVLAVNMCNTNVYISEVAGSEKFYVFSVALCSLVHHFGAGWCGVLGYLLLDQIGWRYFILLTSVPIFIIPLLLFQFVLPESKPDNDAPNDDCSLLESNNNLQNIPKRLMAMRIVRILSYMLTNFTPWTGSILLLPSIVRQMNIDNNYSLKCSSINGTQFLLITIIFGVFYCIGRLLCYVLHQRFRSPTLLSLTSALSIAFLGIMNIFNTNGPLLFALMAVLQIVAAVSINEIEILAANRRLFDYKYLVISAGMQMAFLSAVIALGNVVSATMDYVIALKVFQAFAILGLPAGLSFYIKE